MRNNTHELNYDKAVSQFKLYLINREYEPLKINHEISKHNYKSHRHYYLNKENKNAKVAPNNLLMLPNISGRDYLSKIIYETSRQINHGITACGVAEKTLSPAIIVTKENNLYDILRTQNKKILEK